MNYLKLLVYRISLRFGVVVWCGDGGGVGVCGQGGLGWAFLFRVYNALDFSI